MRIVAGSARGRKLFAPAGEDTRPTAERIREALFNILGARVWDARVLDLFGGTGAMALEAMSRGALECVIVDTNRAAVRAIERNAQAVLGEDHSRRARILRMDYRGAITLLAQEAGEKFDLVFLDPPYRMLESYPDALVRLRAGGLLAEDALLVLEYARGAVLDLPEDFEAFDTRAYGETAVDLVRLREG